MGAIRRINNRPVQSTYQRELEYVKNHIPDKLSGFFAILYQAHPELITKKSNKKWHYTSTSTEVSPTW